MKKYLIKDENFKIIRIKRVFIRDWYKICINAIKIH